LGGQVTKERGWSFGTFHIGGGVKPPLGECTLLEEKRRMRGEEEKRGFRGSPGKVRNLSGGDLKFQGQMFAEG